MLPFSFPSHSFFSKGGLVGLLFALLTIFPAYAEDTFVALFDANWCASCREAGPIIRDICAQNNIPVREIDVDDQNAPRLVKNWGLTIPARDLPQVYLISRGKATQLLDGAHYQIGHPNQIRATLLQNLRQHGAH